MTCSASSRGSGEAAEGVHPAQFYYTQNAWSREIGWGRVPARRDWGLLTEAERRAAQAAQAAEPCPRARGEEAP